MANLKHQDLEKPFVDNFILSQGYPIWKHAKITIKPGNYNSVLPENDTLVSIPIVEDGKEYVKSILAVKVNNEVWYKLLESLKYREFLSPETGSPGETFTVMDLLKMFMEMEYDIFGQSNFVITDEEILENAIAVGGGGGHNYGTQLGLSANGCAVFNWGYYYSGGGFHMLESEEVCINNSAELIYSIEAPYEGGGSGPIDDDEECKRGFVEIKEFDENNEPIIPCEIIKTSPCDQLKKFINNPANEIYMQKVRDLVKDENLELHIEKSVALIEGNSLAIQENSGDQNIPQVLMPFLPEGKKYKSFSHIHSDIPPGTYSIFSIQDLRAISVLNYHGQIKSKDFVSILGTLKGTYYALIISDIKKFEDYFYYENYKGDGSPADNAKWFNSINKSLALEAKYFSGKDPLIKETDTENDNVLEMFLDFIKEADLGVSIFKTDSDLESFTKVEKDHQPTICN